MEVESEISEEELEKRIGEWKEIALFLRRNVVQGEQGEDGAFRMSSLSSLLICYKAVRWSETKDRSESHGRYRVRG